MSNQLPDYSVQYDQEKDQVTFFNRSKKRKEYISETEFVQLGYGKDAYQAAVEVISQGKKIPKDLQEKYNITDKKFIQAVKTAEKSEKKQLKIKPNLILNESTISNIYSTILKNIRNENCISEEVKKSLIKIEIDEHYEQISSNYTITDDSQELVNEMKFKQELYRAFNIVDV